MDRKIPVIGIICVLLLSLTIPCIGVKSTNSIKLNDLKNCLIESSSTDVPPGVYTFENVGVIALGTIPSSQPKLTIEGVPFIKSFLMKLFITGKIGVYIFPYLTSLTKNKYTLTLDFPIDLPDGGDSFFGVGVIDYDNLEPLLNITNQRHTLKVEHEFTSDEYFSFFEVYKKIGSGRFFMYIESLSLSVTITVPE